MTGWNEYDAAVHVLRDPLIESRTEPYILERGIEFDALLAASEVWSHGERLLVLAALDLWNGRAHEEYDGFGLRALSNTLGTDHIRRIIDGWRILERLPVEAAS